MINTNTIYDLIGMVEKEETLEELKAVLIQILVKIDVDYITHDEVKDHIYGGRD